ncbi:MAG TPA: S41 family peptidase [Thermoanaerobaculia bacterium]
MPADTDMTWSRREDWIDARGVRDPLWLADAKAQERMELLPGTKTLYVQINQISESLPTFAEAMRQKIEAEGVERLILDLRLNRGGHGDFNAALLRAIIQSRRVDQPGRFFCIIGPEHLLRGAVPHRQSGEIYERDLRRRAEWVEGKRIRRLAQNHPA